MSDFPASVVDEHGKVHKLLGEPLGRGGQGVVLRTRNPDVAVKLLGTSPSDAPRTKGSEAASRVLERLTQTEGLELAVDDQARQRLQRRIEDVRLLPLRDLHLAQPLALLRGHAGYTMQLLTGMVPIRSLIASPGTQNLSDFYRKTGGLRRRLELLARAAALLSRLHGLSLAYADVSPNNVFVSGSLDATEVWFIDLDNVDYVSTRGPSIHTPGFGAPEVVTGKAGVSTLSDAFSFAVLAFYVLAQVHPFLGGDGIQEGGWDQDVDLEQLALAGEFPWVEDPDDQRNHTAHGIPRRLVLSRDLRQLFERTFGVGRADASQRPGMSKWASVLLQAADRTLRCECGATFDLMARQCGFCARGTQPAFLYAQVNRWDPDWDDAAGPSPDSPVVWAKMLDAALDVETAIHRHVIEPLVPDSNDPPVLRVRVTRRGLLLTPMDARPVTVVAGGKLTRLDAERHLPLPVPGQEILLHFTALDVPHRTVLLSYRPAIP